MRRGQHQHALDALSTEMVEVFGIASEKILGWSRNESYGPAIANLLKLYKVTVSDSL